MKSDYLVCVDDDAAILEGLVMTIQGYLPDKFQVMASQDPNEAIEKINQLVMKNNRVIAVISDYQMPVMRGTEFLFYVNRIVPQSYKILISGNPFIDEFNSESKSYINRFMPKPIAVFDLIFALNEAKKIESLHREINDLTIAMVSALKSAHFQYDFASGLQANRVGRYSGILAHAAGHPQDFVNRISLYANLYDIGKIGLPWSLLTNTEKYKPAEYEIMKVHVLIGGQILESTNIDSMARNIALYHHERWNGSGYLRGLSGNDIPEEARIVMIADTFESLTTKRSYRRTFSIEEACQILLTGKGKHFDPILAECFVDNQKKFEWAFQDFLAYGRN